VVPFISSCCISFYNEPFENKDTKQLRQRSQYPDWSILIGRLEARLSEFKVRSSMDLMRREISEKCRNIAVGDKGLYRLTVPTGGGKTLASLRFGLHHAHEHRMDRIIYVIPYTSIIDQNANLGLYSKRPEWTQPENLDALFIGISEIVDNSKTGIV